jgi:single-stranded DNA-binding protein
MVAGTRVYVEGSLRLDKWEKDGQPRSGLSVMSFHTRIAEIGRNRPRRERKPAEKPRAAGSPSNNFYNDEIGF